MSKLIKNFKKYAYYYDIFYRDKPYDKECDFLEKIFKKYSQRKIYSILDLGCGTGGHDFILAERGHKVTGIDFSSSMIKIAKEKNKEKKGEVKFLEEDMRNFNLKEKFDCVIAMFGVFCYLLTNQDIISVFRAVRFHLKKDGLLIFDCWFGPAVLFQKPREELKIFKKNNEKIIKSVKPNLNILSQTVDLEYKLTRVSGKKVLDEAKEIHKVRFFFPQEIRCLLEKEKFKILAVFPLKKMNKKPGVEDWNITVIAKKL